VDVDAAVDAVVDDMASVSELMEAFGFCAMTHPFS
jgi:hypothetical protein